MVDVSGYVSQGAEKNISLIKNRELYTPGVQDALKGINQATIIQLVGRVKMKIHESKLTMCNLYVADEIFVTGSGARTVGVTHVDKQAASGG